MRLILIIVVLAVVIALYLKSRQPAGPAQAAGKKTLPPGKATEPESTAYHAVSIAASRSACDAAKAWGDERVLSADAPTLPLPDCDAPECHCRFVHHKDRRDSEDRRDPYRGVQGPETGQFDRERRRRPERRHDESRGFLH